MATETEILWYPFALSARADSLIVSRIVQSSSLDFSETLFLTTSLRRSRRLERLFAQEVRERKKVEVVSPPLFTTLDALVKKIFQRVNPLGKVLSEEEKNYLLAQILSKRKGERTNWKVTNSYQSLIKELKEYFLEGRESLGWKIDHFFFQEKRSSRLDFLSAEQANRRVSAALEVFDLYQSFLKENQLYDLEDAFSMVSESLNESNFPYRKVWIDNFYDLTPLAWRLIEKVVNVSGQVVVVSGWEREPSDHPLSYLAHQTFLSFEKLLKTKRQPFLRESEAKKTRVFYQPAKNRHDEIKQIARKICYLARQEKVRLNDLVVTFPDPLPYLSHLKILFSRYGIPYNLSHGFPLKSSPVIKLILDLLNCVCENYPRRLLVSLVRSPFFSLASSELGLFIDFYSRQNGVVKGEESWLECFNEPLYSGAERRKARESKKILERIFSRLNVFNKGGRLSYFNQNLVLTLKDFGFFEKIQQAGKEKVELKAWQSLAEKLSLLESFSQRFFSQEISLADYLDILKMVGENGYYWIEGDETAGVQVVGLLEARGMGYRYLFFGGLADEIYPGKVTKELFFSEKLKEELGLPNYTKRFSLFRFNFKRLIISSELAFLSFPQAEGREVFLKSRFFSDLEEKAREWFVPENILLSSFELQRHLPELKEKSFLADLVDKKALELIRERKKRLSNVLVEGKGRIELKDYTPPTELNVTDVDKYSRCGFIFLYEVVLKLKPLEEPEEEIQPVFWGKMLHDFLASAFKDDLTGLDKYELEEHLRREAQKFFPLGLSSGYGLLKKWVLDAIIKRLAAVETERFSQGFRPALFEKPVEFELNGVKLKGRVDRIDDFRGEGYFLIDFKTKHNLTGKSAVDVKGKFKDDLQLFLYAQGIKGKVLGVGYYVLHEANVGLDAYYARELSGFLGKGTKKFFEHYFEEKKEKAEQIVEKIKGGIFEKNKASCFKCRYREVCLG